VKDLPKKTATNWRSVRAMDSARYSVRATAIERLTVINSEILNLKGSNSRSVKAKD
jgi:hypothetical protein